VGAQGGHKGRPYGIPEGTGLGVEVDVRALEKYRIQ